MDWEGGDGKGRDALCVVWSHSQHFPSMNHNLPGEHISYYANGEFVSLPDLNDIMQGLALSSWKLESEQEGRILSTTSETWVLNINPRYWNKAFPAITINKGAS